MILASKGPKWSIPVQSGENGNNNVKFIDMKKLMYALAAALLVFGGVSCKKKNADTQPTTAPTITWNAESDVVEIGSKENTTMTVTAEEGIDVLTIETVLPSIMVASTFNSTFVDLKANWADETKNGTMDLVNDSKSAAYFSLSSIKNAKSVAFDLNKVVTTLLKGYASKDGDEFTFNVYVKDIVGKEARKTVKFHWTAEPSITWTDNDMTKPYSFKADDVKGVPAQFVIAAPATIEKFLLTVATNSADVSKWLADNMKVQVLDGKVILDLIGNKLVQDFNFGQEIGEALKVKDATLSLSDFLEKTVRRAEAGTQLEITFSVTDSFERTTEAKVIYIVSE